MVRGDSSLQERRGPPTSDIKATVFANFAYLPVGTGVFLLSGNENLPDPCVWGPGPAPQNARNLPEGYQPPPAPTPCGPSTCGGTAPEPDKPGNGPKDKEPKDKQPHPRGQA